MQNFVDLLTNVSDRTFDVTTTSAGASQVQQTQRNALKAEMVNTLATSLATLLADTDLVTRRFDGGVGIEIPNASIADALGSGALTIALDIKVMSLDTDLDFEGDEYDTKQAEKRAKAEEQARKRAEKIERDKAKRAERAKAKAE